jgi:hypothetical protein
MNSPYFSCHQIFLPVSRLPCLNDVKPAQILYPEDFIRTQSAPATILRLYDNRKTAALRQQLFMNSAKMERKGMILLMLS